MEFLPILVNALVELKNLCEQHGDNKKETAKLQKIIEDYKEHLPQIEADFKQVGKSVTSMDDLVKFKVFITDATKKLNEWAKEDRRLFRVFSSARRMQELEHLHRDVRSQTEHVWHLLHSAMLKQQREGQKKLEERQKQLGDKLEKGQKQLREGQKKIIARIGPIPPQAQPVRLRVNQRPQLSGYAHLEPPPFSIPSRTVEHKVLNADHELVATANGEVYAIVEDPTTKSSKVWMCTGKSNFVRCDAARPVFRSTCRPITSRSGRLYVGGMILPRSDRPERPAVMVWDGRHFTCCLQTPKAHASARWEYTFLARSCTDTSIYYYGCSDGTIETWEYVASHKSHSYRGALRGHEGAIRTLAVQRDGILLSVDEKHINVVRVWRKQSQVAVLNLKHEKVFRMACTSKRNMYVVTESGSLMWCDLEDVLGRDAAKIAAGSHFPKFGLEIFSSLPRPSTSTSIARSCRQVEGTSETIYCTSSAADDQGTFFIEEWHGKDFVAKFDTGSKVYQSLTISKYSTLFISSKEAGEMYEWKFTKPTVQRRF